MIYSNEKFLSVYFIFEEFLKLTNDPPIMQSVAKMLNSTTSNLKLFNIIVIICDIPNLKECITVH